MTYSDYTDSQAIKLRKNRIAIKKSPHSLRISRVENGADLLDYFIFLLLPSPPLPFVAS